MYYHTIKMQILLKALCSLGVNLNCSRNKYIFKACWNLLKIAMSGPNIAPNFKSNTLFNIILYIWWRHGKYTISHSNNCSSKTQALFKWPVFDVVVSEQSACTFSFKHQSTSIRYIVLACSHSQFHHLTPRHLTVVHDHL